MADNFLERLAAEWFEFQGYFVRRNVFVGPLKSGGFESELDVVAFHPETKHLVHVEASMDADSWAKREARFRRKFAAGRQYIHEVVKGLDASLVPDQFALLVFASTQSHETIGGGKILLLDDLLRQIFTTLRTRKIANNAVPEHLPILRAFQCVSVYRDAVWRALSAEDD